MYKVVTHPSNAKHFKDTLRDIRDIDPMFVFMGIEIVVDSCLPKDVPSGRYRLPNGRIVAKADISIKTRWIEYGPEDFDWLMFARIITEHRESYYMVIDDSKLRQIQSQPLAIKFRPEVYPDFGRMSAVVKGLNPG